MSARALIVIATLVLAAGAYWLLSPSAPEAVKEEQISPISDLDEVAPPPLESPVEAEAPPVDATEPQPSAPPAAAPASFRERLRATRASLPTLQKMSKLSEKEAHQTPAFVAEAGMALGKIMDEVEANPELKPEAARFFGQCAASKDLSNTVRALCYRNYGLIGDRNVTPSISPEVKELVDKLNE